VWHQFTVRVTEEAAVSRDEFVAKLGEAGVGAGVYYPRLLWDYDAYRDHPNVIKRDAPVAEQVASQVVSLPVHNSLSDEDLDTIVETVAAVAGGHR